MAITARLTLGNIWLLEIDDADPDTILTAPAGSLAIRIGGATGPWINTDGATAWSHVDVRDWANIAAVLADFTKINAALALANAPIAINGQNVTGAGAGAIPVAHQSIPADSQIDTPGAATETIHTAIALAAATVGTARTTIDFFARFVVDASVGLDTWQMRLRVGGLAGVLIADSTAFDIADGDVVLVQGTIQISALGAPGTFDAFTEVINMTAGTRVMNEITDGAITTTGAVDLVCTGECNTANANAVTLTDFRATARR